MVDKKLLKILRNIAILLRIKGENPFKADAYEKAADIIEANQLDIGELVRLNKLSEIKGFGEALVKKITEYVQTGKLEYYERLKKEVPPELITITRLPNLGPKRTKFLYETLGISTMDELERACLEDKIAKLKGFSKKSQEIILNGIQHYRAWKGKIQQFACFDRLKEIQNVISNFPEIVYISATGEVRRITELVTKISFLVGTKSPNSFKEFLSQKFRIHFENSAIHFLDSEEVPTEIEITKPENFFWRLHNSTGSEDYLQAFRCYFEQLTRNDFDLFNPPTAFSDLQSEYELFSKLDLQYISPELRETSRIIEIAKSKRIPKLIETQDLRGMIHVHTNWSDGHNSIEEMAEESKRLGFEYVVICDHSQTAKYANGLEPERLLRQIEYIDRLNETNNGIKILKGIESDILPNGSLDYPAELLEKLDVVVASVHSNFKITKSEMTRRVMYALKSPYTTILGHPTGRLLLARQSYEIDIKAIIDVAADYGKIIEFNANPYRLDLPWENLEYAKEKGVKISLNPDSHDSHSLSDIFYGLNFLRKGLLEPNDVVNTFPFDGFVKFCIQNRQI